MLTVRREGKTAVALAILVPGPGGHDRGCRRKPRGTVGSRLYRSPRPGRCLASIGAIWTGRRCGRSMAIRKSPARRWRPVGPGARTRERKRGASAGSAKSTSGRDAAAEQRPPPRPTARLHLGGCDRPTQRICARRTTALRLPGRLLAPSTSANASVLTMPRSAVAMLLECAVVRFRRAEPECCWAWRPSHKPGAPENVCNGAPTVPEHAEANRPG
jgi:hypothetical protein